jgi:aspartyl-tRNA synthetase
MQQTLRTRYRVTKMMRDYLGDLGFWEIETPFLTKSTPEARATSSCRRDFFRGIFMRCRSRRSSSSSC